MPGTEMPAWNQALGGPLTDQQVSQLVAFIRNWETTAPDRHAEALQGDPAQGLVIFDSTCVVCHGENGQGTDRASALNDPARLKKFDDEWYRNAIAHGRPAKGMPTWGTVLSPAQIQDIVALLAVWHEGGSVAADIPLAVYLTNALFAPQNSDPADAEFFLNAALQF